MIKAVGLCFFMVLKLAGMLLLILFLILLACLLLAVLVPVGYCVEIQNPRAAETADRAGIKASMEDVRIQFRFTWLFRFIHITLKFEQKKFHNTIRIAGIDIQKLLAKVKKKKNKTGGKKSLKQQKAAEKRTVNKKGTEKQAARTPEPALEQAERELDGEKEGRIQKPDKEESAAAGPEGTSTAGQTPGRKEAPKARSRKAASKAVHPAEKSGARKPGAAAEHRTSKIAGVKKKAGQFHQELVNDTNRNAVMHVWKEICFLFSHYKPRKLKADMAFSLANPALTGKVLGLISLVPAVYRYPCSIVPDFESEVIYIEGFLMMKGRVSAGVCLISLIRLLRDEETMQCAHRLMGKSS